MNFTAKALTVAAAGTVAVIGLLIWSVRSSAYKAGVSDTNAGHQNALNEVQTAGDEIVASQRDPAGTVDELSNANL